MVKPRARVDFSDALAATFGSERCTQCVGRSVEFGRINGTIRLAKVDIGLRCNRKNVQVRVRYLESSDDERNAFSLEGRHLGGANLAGDNGQMSGHLVGQVDPVVNFEPRHDKRMAGANRGDCEKSNTDIISINKASWKVAIDDLRKQGAHGLGIVECCR